MNPLVPGFGLIFLAAVAGGAYPLPLRIRKRFETENTIVIAQLFAMLIIPLLAAQFVLPNWPSAVTADPWLLATVIALGFGWGVGAVTYAIAIVTVGVSLGFTIIMGLVLAVGAIIPMARRWAEIPSDAKIVALVGIIVAIVGVVICGKAGMLRERAAEGEAHGEGGSEAGSSGAAKPPMTIFLVGLFWCILSGILSACANLGYDHAEPIGNRLAEMGADPRLATLSRWLSLYWGGYLAVLIFFGSRLITKGYWKNFSGPGAQRDFGLAVMMGCIHFLAQIPYGAGAYYLGKMGTSVGWAVNIASSLIVANIIGFILGEWRKAPRASVSTLCWGLLILIGAMIILAYGNTLVPS